MQSYRNRQSGIDEAYRRQNRRSGSYQIPTFPKNMNNDVRHIYRPSSEIDFKAEYDFKELGRLPTMQECFAFERLRQAVGGFLPTEMFTSSSLSLPWLIFSAALKEEDLRDFRAGSDQLLMNSSGGSPQWACSCGNSSYDHTGGFSTHAHRNSSALLGDHLALRGPAPYLDSASLFAQGHHGAGISYPRGSSRTGYSLGESLPRSTIRKTEQLARRRANTTSACGCHQSYPPQIPTRYNQSISDFWGTYGSPYVTRQGNDDVMAGRLRRASSGTSLGTYGSGY